jgi:hypothetical protein
MNPNSKYYNEYYDYILKEIEPSTKSKKIIFNIISDLTDRRVLKQSFNQIDGDVQDEIIEAWIEYAEDK